ncbi:hypothetical protein [uncultured Sphaerochaeta sp.]|uniref:hypothetical protein n=1 Tax=uncultured Sphaerochaeta sp. TaxID=886478 RepID=UPI002A0A2588|nr:hypothetical protein [uncultured Sphaerochaeta sp.]
MFRPIDDLQDNNRNIILLLATVLILSLATNLLASLLFKMINNLFVIIILCLISLLFGILLLKNIYFSHHKYVIRLYGGYWYNLKSKELEKVSISGYEFNNDFHRYLFSFLNENKAFKNIFEKNKKGITINKSSFDPTIKDKLTILRSTLEVVVLDFLQLHLNSYFIKNEINDFEIIKITRDNLDPSILKNRVLDSITKDMDEREAFINDNSTSLKEKNCSVVYSMSKNGIFYNRLEIELPSGTTIHRNNEGFIEIDNKLFKLTIVPIVEGYSSIVSSVLFEDGNYKCGENISLNLEVQIKRSFIIPKKSIQVYQWLDSFLQAIEEYISIDKLEKKMKVDVLQLIIKNLKSSNNIFIQNNNSKIVNTAHKSRIAKTPDDIPVNKKWDVGGNSSKMLF